MHVAAGRQKNIAGAKHTPATRLPRDLTEDEHVEAALSLRHPFRLDAKLEADAVFAVEACARLGPDGSGWRNRFFNIVRKLARALAPLGEWALAHRPTRHCLGWSPVLTAAFVHLLRWRDRTLPWALVAGFQVVGNIPASRIHREVEPAVHITAELRGRLLDDSAIEYVS